MMHHLQPSAAKRLTACAIMCLLIPVILQRLLPQLLCDFLLTDGCNVLYEHSDLGTPSPPQQAPLQHKTVSLSAESCVGQERRLL